MERYKESLEEMRSMHLLDELRVRERQKKTTAA
jgi:hypothetical protein